MTHSYPCNVKRPDQALVFPAFVPLAHQGGWDEILLVVAPLALIGGLLWLANRRVSAQLDAQAGTDAPSSGDGPETSGSGSDGSTTYGSGEPASGGNGHR